MNRGSFVLASLGTVFIAMLPLGLTTTAGLTPDLFFALVFAWIIRRPETLPLGLVAIMALFMDVMLMRPVGLWALFVILASEYFRMTGRTLREQMFAIEWLVFAVAFALGQAAQLLILKLAFVDAPGLRLVFGYMFITIIAYPAVVGVIVYGLRIRAPGQVSSSRNGGML